MMNISKKNKDELKNFKNFIIKNSFIFTIIITIIISVFFDIKYGISFAIGSFVSLLNLLVQAFVLDKALGEGYGRFLLKMVTPIRIAFVVIIGLIIVKINYIYLILYILGNASMILVLLRYSIKGGVK